MHETYTLATLQARLADRWEHVPFWTSDDARDAINEALGLYNLLTGTWRRTVDIDTSATWNHDYALPSTLTFRTRVLFDGEVVENSSLFDLAYGRPNWRNETTADGTPVPTRPLIWVPLSLQLILIWPAPAFGHTLTVEGISDTPRLVDADDSVDVDDGSIGPLIDCALSIATFKEGSERFTAAQGSFTTFLAHCATVNGQLLASNIFRRFAGLDPHPRRVRGLPGTRLETT